MNTSEHDTAFHVDPWTHFLGGMVARSPGLFQALGSFESRLLSARLADIEIQQPIFIAGLARSGTTLLLEVLDRHPDTASHRYRDFPMLHIPFLWNRFLEFTPRAQETPAERAHKDGILVTADSPEAFEEVLWMNYFSTLHDATRCSILDAATANPEFERFYRDHIRKLLLVRGGRRYLSKGNYNITRLEYLLRLFPDARFLIPVRDPVWHIASLRKQHRLFCQGQENNPRAVKHLQRVGHFEFGLDRRPINTGNDAETRAIVELWNEGNEVEGWARYWNDVYGFLAEQLQHHPALRRAAMLVSYETLCRDPRDTLRGIFSHAQLQVSDVMLERAAKRVQAPSYYQPDFSPQELESIERHTHAAQSRLQTLGAEHQM